MNYTINYPSTGGNNGHIPVHHQAQRIVITPPQGQNAGNMNPPRNQQSFPMMMQVGAANQPVFYTYPTAEVNKSNEGQVIVAPMSPVQNNV